MATTTDNYGLIKPLSTDYYDIEIQNGNMDRIDAAIKDVEEHADELDEQNVKLDGEQILTGVKFFPTLISNGDNNHLQFFRNFSKEWHMEALDDKLSIVQSGVAERLLIGKDGNININGTLNVTTPTQNSHASNKQYVDANKYVHPTTAGNKHIPAGGAAGQVLGYAGSSGTASWQKLNIGKIAQMSGGVYHDKDNYGILTFTAEDIDELGAINLGSSTSRITIPSGVSRARFYWTGSMTSYKYGVVVDLLKNGSKVQEMAGVRIEALGNITNTFYSRPVNCTQGDYFQLSTYMVTTSHIDDDSTFGIEVIA